MTQTDLRKVLIFAAQENSESISSARELLAEHFQLETATSLDDATAAIERGDVEMVLLGEGMLGSLAGEDVRRRARSVLDQMGEGVCLMALDGEITWRNRLLREATPKLSEALERLCPQACTDMLELADKPVGDVITRRYSLMPGDGSYHEVTYSPVRSESGQFEQIAAVVIDITAQRRQQLKMNAIDDAARELVRLDAETISQKDATGRLELLEDRIIRCSRDVLEYHHFALFVLDERTNKLDPLVSEGLDDDEDQLQFFATTEGNGITGYVAATGKSYICHDAKRDPRYIRALRNPGSCLAVPLRMHDRVIGVFLVESDRVGAFNEEDRQFADIFANYVAMALNMLNLLTHERYTTHSQISGSIGAEVAGPINDIITKGLEIMEDYIGLDDLRDRLADLIDQASSTRDRVHSWMQSPRTGVLPSSVSEGKLDPCLSGKRVLVVDDETLIRETIANVLLPCGCDVDQAHDGSVAIEKLEKVRYDLVISDIKMPGATGYEVFTRARELHEETEVILITAFGYDPSHSIVKANREGLAAVLMKPFKVNDLLTQCRKAFATDEDH
jgi:two-component system, sensor histidine kinase SagS